MGKGGEGFFWGGRGAPLGPPEMGGRIFWEGGSPLGPPEMGGGFFWEGIEGI